ncbi:MAG: aminotransferase class V-fold PLP-dependent enzyme, partial [Clostridia bacterium]
MKWEDVRKQFPITREYVFLDQANKCALPKFSTEVIEDYIDKQQKYSGDKQEWFKALEEARDNFAKLINANPDEIAFTKNTSEGLNIAANGIPLKKGDTVLLNQNEHPNNIYCWLNLRRKGVKVKWIPTEEGTITVDNIKKVMDDSVKVISFSSVTYAPGNRNDVKNIVDYCKKRNIYTVVDAVQSVGTLKVDVKELGMDILCTSGHKALLCPHGVGVIYISKRVLDDITPVYVARAGMGMAAQIEHGEIKYELDKADSAKKFEIGNYNYLGITVFNEALKYLLSLGMENVENKILELYSYLVKRLEELNLEIVSPKKGNLRSAILCFKAKNARELHEVLMKNNIINTLRRDMIRVSLGI